MKKLIAVIAVLVMAFMFTACGSFDTIRYAGNTDKEMQTAPCVVVETVEEAAVPAAAPIEIVKVVKIRQPIMFPFDSAEITDQEMAKIDALANILIENPDTLVVVNGWASSEGSDDYNMDLSGQRAMAVQSALIDKGIADDRIETVAKGETGLFGDLLKLNRRAIVLDVE